MKKNKNFKSKIITNFEEDLKKMEARADKIFNCWVNNFKMKDYALKYNAFKLYHKIDKYNEKLYKKYKKQRAIYLYYYKIWVYSFYN